MLKQIYLFYKLNNIYIWQLVENQLYIYFLKIIPTRLKIPITPWKKTGPALLEYHKRKYNFTKHKDGQ